MKKMMPMMMLMGFLMLLGIFFTYQGVSMQNRVAGEEAKFHQLQGEYFSISKAERDSAETGSELNQKLVVVQNYPSALLELKLVGVGKILTGIFILLFGILIALIMMPVRLGKMIKESSMQNK